MGSGRELRRGCSELTAGSSVLKSGNGNSLPPLRFSLGSSEGCRWIWEGIGYRPQENDVLSVSVK